MNTLEALRHSTAHVLASAIRELYPKARLAIGPSIDEGFYYDFDNLDISENDLPKIEKKMQEIISNKLDFKKSSKTYQEAKKLLKDEPYKIELLEELKKNKETITFYQNGSFMDLCAGPHIKNTSDIKAFKLLRLAGAYWKGDSKNKMLTRIYGTSFQSKKELDDYLKLREEAEKRDHRKLGVQLDLYEFKEESPGSPFFYPKGTVIYNALKDFMAREYRKRGYQEVITPLLYDKSLWEKSGHWKHFKDDMFILNIDNKEFALKPMNCPSHVLIYSSRLRSYKDLPLRIADFAPLHRNELRGVLGGLTRVRKFSQDDAHIFCTEEQIEQEVTNVIDFINYIYKDVFKFEYSVELSTKPEKAMGEAKLWNKAEAILKNILEKKKIKFRINPGEGAFYGPKIDLHIKDAIGRSHQLATVQLDFQMPSSFNITYEGSDGKKHTPIMIHRAIFGSIERFIGILIEHYSGNMPLWLNPVQVKLLTFTDRNRKYAEKILNELVDSDLRVELDDRNETVNKKVFDAQAQKTNYIVTVGDKEEKANTLAVRSRDGKVKFGVKPDDFIKQLQKEIKEKA